MRCLERNKVTFYYALYLREEIVTDEYGYESGSPAIVYGDPVEMQANISPATGNAQTEQFGKAEQYDRVIVTDDLTCPIDENSVLCVDVPPRYDDDGNLLFDYVVKKIARSLNSVSIAISKVNVS